MTVAIPALAAASTTIPAPTKFRVVILPAVPTAEPSSRTEIPSIAPAGAEVTHCGAEPEPFDDRI